MREPRNLFADIFELMRKRKATLNEGNSAMSMALVISLMGAGIGKAEALNAIGKIWDVLERDFEAFEAETKPRKFDA